MSPCPCCGGSAWRPLPNPHDARAVLSDLRVIAEALDKSICEDCGLVRRFASFSGPHLFASGYSLYDHAPGAPREDERQDLYASWIAARVTEPPASVLDVGCGNGSLLVALRKRWPRTRLRGIDPSHESTAHARVAGIDAVAGTLEDVRPASAPLVLCVNVVEHTSDPAAFIRQLTDVVEPDGRLLLVCPDGRTPWIELLFADHGWSLGPDHVAILLERSGWRFHSVLEAPAALGPFMMIVGRRGAAQPSPPSPRWDAGTLGYRKEEYLRRWRTLDATVLSRSKGGDLICFGIGEAAGLLRAYAPRAWSRVVACAADMPERQRFGDLRVHRTDDIPPHAEILLGVRPAAQARLVARFQDRHHVIRWDDVIPA